MTNYEAPTISSQKDLRGRLVADLSHFNGASDAEIKHGVELVSTYEAPEITAQRELDGRLQDQSNTL